MRAKALIIRDYIMPLGFYLYFTFHYIILRAVNNKKYHVIAH